MKLTQSKRIIRHLADEEIGRSTTEKPGNVTVGYKSTLKTTLLDSDNDSTM